MTAETIFAEAKRIGLRLERRGENLVVRPRNLITPDFRTAVRLHKQSLLGLLANQGAGLTPDQVPWLHVARQILSGEFEGADRSTIQSLTIGLRSIAHPVCRRALERLQNQSHAANLN